MEAKMLNCSVDAMQQRRICEKQSFFIMQIKLAQRQSRARLGKAQKFPQRKKLIFFFGSLERKKIVLCFAVKRFSESEQKKFIARCKQLKTIFNYFTQQLNYFESTCSRAG